MTGLLTYLYVYGFLKVLQLLNCTSQTRLDSPASVCHLKNIRVFLIAFNNCTRLTPCLHYFMAMPDTITANIKVCSHYNAPNRLSTAKSYRNYDASSRLLLIGKQRTGKTTIF